MKLTTLVVLVLVSLATPAQAGQAQETTQGPAVTAEEMKAEMRRLEDRSRQRDLSLEKQVKEQSNTLLSEQRKTQEKLDATAVQLAFEATERRRELEVYEDGRKNSRRAMYGALVGLVVCIFGFVVARSRNKAETTGTVVPLTPTPAPTETSTPSGSVDSPLQNPEQQDIESTFLWFGVERVRATFTLKAQGTDLDGESANAWVERRDGLQPMVQFDEASDAVAFDNRWNKLKKVIEARSSTNRVA